MLVKLLIYIIVGVLVFRLVKSLVGGQAKRQDRMAGQAPERVDDVMVKDPQCGAYFPQRKAVALNDAGEELYFCSVDCRDRYAALKETQQ